MDSCVHPGDRCSHTRSAVSLTALLIVVGLVLAGWASTAKAAEPRLGGVLNFGVENDFAGFDVMKSGSRLAINGAIANNTIQEPLFRLDRKGSPIPVLGLMAKADEGGKDWTVTLRRGVVFHDGSPFDADAVVVHYQRLLNPENKYRGRGDILPIQAVEKIDTYTVRFSLEHSWLPFLSVISDTRGLGATIPSPKSVAAGTQDRAPVGTGPFMFKEWQSGDRFVVVKNPGYWDRGKPCLDGVVFRPMPDHQTRFASLISGETDLIWMDRGSIIEKARADNTLQVFQDEDNGGEIFILNTAKPPLDDIRVRRALAYAHSQDLQVKMVYNDSIPVVRHPFGPDVVCNDTGYLEFDPAKSGPLLSECGKPVEIECLHSNSDRGRDIGQLTQKLFKDVGIGVNPVGLDFGPVVKKVITGDYQLSTWRISSRPDLGPSLFAMFHSKSKRNFSHYSTPELDKLLEAQRLETDPTKRNDLLCRIVRQVNQDAPILYRGGMRYHVIAGKRVRGISDINRGIVPLTEAWLAD